MNLFSNSTNAIKDHRGTIIFWIIFSFVVSSLGQIIADSPGFYLALALIGVIIFIFYSRKNFHKIVIGFLLIFILVLGFVVVKNVNASPNQRPEPMTKELVSVQPETSSDEESEATPPEPEKEPYSCSTLGNFKDNISQWCELIETKASEHGLDPVLVASVIQIESKGNPEAISSMRAVGLMQVMPNDAGYPIFYQRPSTDELLDPETNIEWGCKLLSGYIQTYGSIRDGLLHYGPIDYGYIYADEVLDIYKEKSNQ